MKPLFFVCSGAAILLAALSPAAGQEVSQEVKVNVKGVKVQAQNTPQFNVQNMVDKRWRPKTWLEIDVDFEARKAVNPQDKSPVVESLEFKYFVGLNKATADGKYVVLTATVNYSNIIEKEDQHALVFASPLALARILEKTSFTTSDVKAIGVEIYRGGGLAGWYTSGGQRWWDKLEQFSVVDGVLLPKNKTPFAPLWGDYDAQVAD